MGFIEDVQAWLKAQASPPAPLPPLPPGFDLEKRRGVMWGALGEIGFQPSQRRAHERWTTPGYLTAFLTTLVHEVRESVGKRWGRAKLARAADLTLVAEIHGREVDADEAESPILALELSRIGTLAKSAADSLVGEGVPVWCRAVRAVDDGDRPTPIGRTLVGLPGREAVRFALELEIALSTGVADDQRVTRQTLAEVAAKRIGWQTDDEKPAGFHSFERLEFLGVVTSAYQEETGYVWVKMAPDAEDLLRSLLDPAPNPYRALVQALLDAERGNVTTAITGGQATGGSDLAYVRMVVHELRNISFPLATALRSLWEELERPTIDPARISELRERLDRSVAGITEFSNVSARLALAVTEETFSLRDAVDAAIDSTIPERNGRIRVDTSGLVDASIDGARMRWTLLFVNLLRNAAQSRAGSGTVWIHSRWNAAGTLHLYVDDDGPGVPAELREQILEMGVSLRGGSGWGLHEARTTVLLCGGSMRCEASPQGGARFFIRVPARSHA
ncbi:MAG: HAMP domain-containing sensor histidine kinase [Myxococcota bacterium]